MLIIFGKGTLGGFSAQVSGKKTNRDKEEVNHI